jgi:hypothetical protein
VLEQQNHISNASLFPQLYQPLLQAQAGLIIDGPELNDGNQNPIPVDLPGSSTGKADFQADAGVGDER